MDEYGRAAGQGLVRLAHREVWVYPFSLVSSAQRYSQKFQTRSADVLPLPSNFTR
ncbi:hypothetical protein SAMN04489708_13921 [Paracidovorax cattleyae]|uniref:Uncharacterized protein n=1 Tax=Paracidovorax cattleyae TaxID=80868 RepID=A0A1H0WHL2_9BURK|nr:hypothetical protein SAMN04489708_13921 [Paracidovorax cattleyae]